jgi:hypothetical protein
LHQQCRHQHFLYLTEFGSEVGFLTESAAFHRQHILQECEWQASSFAKARKPRFGPLPSEGCRLDAVTKIRAARAVPILVKLFSSQAGTFDRGGRF